MEGDPVHPSDFRGQNSIVKDRMHAFRDEAARHRLVRRPPVKPKAVRYQNRVGRVVRPVRAIAMAVGLVLVRVGMALGASPMDNV